jgi:hypothetical protein
MEAQMRIALLLSILSIAAAQAIFAAGQTVAVLPSEGVLNDEELEFLTDKAQEMAVRVLPKSSFEVFPQEVIIKRLGGADNYVKECKESSCIVDLGRKAMVDYVAQCRFGKLGSDLTVIFELYKVSTSGLIDKFSERAKNVDGLLAIMQEKIPDGFMKIPGGSSVQAKTALPPVAGGIRGSVHDLENAVDIELGYKEPKKIDPQVEVKNESNKSFWVALALDIAGIVLVGYGYAMDREVANGHEDYSSLGSQATQHEINDTWKKVEEAKTARNTGYILGSIFLATGIGVHIWF